MELAHGQDRDIQAGKSGWRGTNVTGMLASVRDGHEAALVLEAGVDIIDLKDPGRGALGALDAESVSDIVRRVDGRVRLSATIGDVPFSTDIRAAVEAMAARGVDLIKIGVFDDPINADVLRMLSGLSRRGLRIVLVFFAEDPFYERPLEVFALNGITGVMLDTRHKESGSLRHKLTDQRLCSFVHRARETGLLCGLAGSIGRGDVPALLPMQPDYLGFRGALCRENSRTEVLDAATVVSIRNALYQPVMQED